MTPFAAIDFETAGYDPASEKQDYGLCGELL